MAVDVADEALLAELGYKQEFRRAFTPFEVFGIAFSIIGLIPSIATILFFAIPNGGPSAMVWGWLVASIFLVFVGLSMAELSSAAPTAGGLYFWTHSLSSPRCRNLLCWIVGYFNTMGNIGGVASVSWGCAVQVMAAASIGSGQTFSATSAQTYGVFVAINIASAVICSLGTRVLARLQTVYIIANVLLCLVVIIALPIATPKEFKNSASFALGGFTNLNGWTPGYAFILSFLAPLFTICAFDSTVHISEEASNPATAIPWAIIYSVSIAAILGWAVNISLAFCMGTDLEGILSSPIGQPLATIFFNSFGQKATLAIWACVVVVQFTMGTSALLASSRQTFAFARDGALPGSRWLYRMNSLTKTPVNTVWFCISCSMLLGLLVFAGEEVITSVFTLSVIALYIAYSIPISARFIFTNNFKPGPFSIGRFGLPCGVIAVSWMSFMGIVFLFPTTPQTSAQQMNYSVVVLGGVLLLSLGWYYFPVYGGVHWFTGPVPNIDGYKGSEMQHGVSNRDSSDSLMKEKLGSEELKTGALLAS